MAQHLGSSAPPSIPGRLLTHDDNVDALKAAVAELLQRENLRFPGAQPVSFARKHIAELQTREYFMCEKTDGIRCLMYLTFWDNNGVFEPVTILIDRKNNYYNVTPALRFPYHADYRNPEPFLYGTILDGELVNDARPDGGRQLIFYIFDCLAVDSENMCAKTLDKRLGYMNQKMIDPWKNYMRWSKTEPPTEPFVVKEKKFQSAYHISVMFNDVLPNLKHGNDGLIFTCKGTRYVHGTDNAILKWKPPHENTIDFRLRLGEFPLYDPEDGEDDMVPDYEAMPEKFQLLVNHSKNDYRPFQHDLEVTPEEWTMFKSLNQRLDGRIIECYRSEDGHWRFKKDDDGTPRWRDDKTDANHISTVQSVLDSIEDPVTEQDLRNNEATIRDAVQRMRQEDARVQQEQVEHAAKKRKFSEANGA
ncbi:mRNA capping enzyme, alpha subunit [Massarina eburnea CBS 473.64]|uniref:mRNA-capping enzyme subunit alpha n=1 Tax=Massarina eburnea CBS 473.64 TaxID=1395130 RepID=A0A6A6S1P2_9PLEO|nr:mRNA capping enzyme, alpha subunit [Massarina eburnea CBS 473.64]